MPTTVTGHRKWSYPIMGAALALGAPFGFLVLHAVQESATPTPGWVVREIWAHPFDYTYLTVSTLLAFTFLGWLVGHKDDRLHAGALTDPLTDLWNRRLLDERLKHELERGGRYRSPLSLLLLDVDRLKDINDRRGHAAGDEALKRVGKAITNSCRSSDVPARFGGDEFAVLAPSTSAADAVGLAQRIQEALARGGKDREPVTVSIGVADLTDSPSLEPSAFYRAADQALYKAKTEGRNRVARVSGGVSDVRPAPRSVDAAQLRLRLCTRHVYSADGKVSGEMRVFCPDKERSVSVEECVGCPNWKGLYLAQGERVSFLHCLPKSGARGVVDREVEVERARLSDVMTPSVVCVSPELSVQAVLDIFLEKHISGAPVLNAGGKPIGVISKTDLLKAKNLAVDIDDPERVPETVEQMMTPLVFALQEGASVSQAAGLMAAEGVHRLFVTAPDGALVGIVSSLDVLRWVAEREGYVRPSGHSPTASPTPQPAETTS